MRPNLRYVYGFDFDFLQFPTVKSSNIFTVSLNWPEEIFKDEKRRGYKGGFSLFANLWFLLLKIEIGLMNFLDN